MAYAVFVVGLSLFVAAIVIAVKTAAMRRRDADDLGQTLSEARGRSPRAEEYVRSWTSGDLAGLGYESADIDKGDPFDTLQKLNAPIKWRASPTNGTEVRPPTNGSDVTPHTNGSDTSPMASHVGYRFEPGTRLTSTAWRGQIDAPVIILVAGVGFIGAETAAGAKPPGSLLVHSNGHGSVEARERPTSSDPEPIAWRAPTPRHQRGRGRPNSSRTPAPD
jgi:hypothetical protein